MKTENRKSTNLKNLSARRLWLHIYEEAKEVINKEPFLKTFIQSSVLQHETFAEAVINRIAFRLSHPLIDEVQLFKVFQQALISEPDLENAILKDILAVRDRDPACLRLLDPFLYFKGFHALQTHRLAHHFWKTEQKDFALYLQSRASEVFQTDIHPAAHLGKGIMLDHATGLVVGSTSVIGDDVSLLQGITLGGTGKDQGDRHPKIGNGVLIGAGAIILGNIKIGHCARIAAGSVVLNPVPARTTVAGVPARVIGEAPCVSPSLSMDHTLVITTKKESGK